MLLACPAVMVVSDAESSSLGVFPLFRSGIMVMRCPSVSATYTATSILCCLPAVILLQELKSILQRTMLLWEWCHMLEQKAGISWMLLQYSGTAQQHTRLSLTIRNAKHVSAVYDMNAGLQAAKHHEGT